MNEDLAMALEALRTKHASILDINERIALRVAANWLISQTESDDNDDGEPDDEGWIKCNGQPDLPSKTYIIIRTRGGYVNDSPETVEFWATGYGINNWTLDDEGRIAAYRVVK